MSADSLKPSPMMDTVRLESEPPGAEAKVSTGQTCRTPCALALPVNSPLTVTFTLNGYLPESQSVEPITVAGSPTQMQPNPVLAELSPAPPGAAKPVKKPQPEAAKKKTPPKQAAKPAKPAATQSQQAAPAPAPWPSTPAQR